MDGSNIIKFPRYKLNTPPQSPEDVLVKIVEYKTSFADELSEILWNYVLGEMGRAGIDFENKYEELFTSMLFLLESIRALHLRADGIEHPLQEIADDIFITEGTADEQIMIVENEFDEE